MKALKEKRVSLRSLFRRSLVILSILALAFMACGGDDNSTTDPGPSEPGTPPVTPDPDVVVSIQILQQPTVESYQGLPPNLTGVIAEVVWSNGRREVVSDTSKFFSLPGYCDYANVKEGMLLYTEYTPVDMSLGYIGSNAISGTLRIPMVVPAAKIEITGGSVEKWYADRRPDFTGLSYEVTFPEGYYTYADFLKDIAPTAVISPDATTPISGSTSAPALGWASGKDFPNLTTTVPPYDGLTDIQQTLYGSGKYTKTKVAMMSSYPKIVMTQAKSDSKLIVRIGTFDNAGTVGSGTPGVGGGHHFDAPLENPVYGVVDGIQTDFYIKSYLEVSGVEFVSASSMPDIFDDEGDLFYTTKGTVVANATPSNPLINKTSVLNNLEKWGLRFKVFYFGGETREITFDEFMGNNAYYNTVVLSGGAWNTDGGPGIGIGDGGLPKFNREDAVVTADQVTYAGGLLLMKYDEDSGNWNVTLEYSPVNYRADDQAFEGAWVTQVDVPIPLYIFDDTIAVKKNAAAGLNNIRINGSSSPDLDIKDKTAFTDSVNAKWIFEGTYAKGRDRKQREMDFTDDMLLWAERYRLDTYTLTDQNLVLAAVNALAADYIDPTYTGLETDTSKCVNNDVTTHPDYNDGSVVAADKTPLLAVLRDHWIGVYFRNQYLSGEDSVLVDVINQVP